jgi:hypothetical protein
VADYGVNINLRVKGQSGLDRLKTKVNELSASIDKIRGVDIMNPRNIGGKGGKGLRKEIKKYRQDMDDLVQAVNKSTGAFGKTTNQQIAAADALEEYSKNLSIGTKEHKLALAASNKQSQAIGRETTQIIKNTKAQVTNNKVQAQATRLDKFNNRSNRAAFTSGAISGAFPLLFGQGIAGGIAGFGGGFLGTKVGGQMGGFAGGLVATAGLQMLTNLRDGMVELGDALSPANANIDQSIEKLKIINSSRAAEIKLIEQLEGKQAALAEITKETAKVVGNDGVRALREFAETMKLITGGMATQFLKIQAGLANILNKVFTFAGGDLSKAKSQLGSDDPLIAALNKNLNAQIALDESVNRDEAFGGGSLMMTPEGRKESKRLRNEQKRLEMAIKIRAEKEAGMRIDKQIAVEHNQLKATTFAQFEMEERILELRRDGLNPALAKQVSLFELSAKNVKIGLENELDSVNKILEAEKESSGTYTDKIMLLEIRKHSLEEQLKLNGKLLQSDKNRIIEADRLRQAQAKIDSLYASIASTVETGLVDAIEGAINGTKTLGDVARSVFSQISRSLIQFGVNSLLTSIFPGFPGRANGGPVSAGKSYMVGERGPEMFVPNAGGRVVSNSDMGSSTNVVVNVDASGSSVEGDEQRGKELGVLISAAVQSEIIQQQRPGGLLA